MKWKRKGSLRSIFAHSDKFDALLMFLGMVGAVGDGLVTPFTLLITSSLMNDIGIISADSDLNSALIQSVNKNALFLCYVASGAWLLCFLEGYCWTRTAERQAARMRVDCLGAVLRQDIGYFDLQDTNTSEIVTIVSNDSLVVQDCIAEKVPNFVMNMSSFVGNEMAAFLMSWNLAIVELPFVILLVIPGLMYGRTMMGIARKLKEEYKEPGSIVEQAIASIRTVYAFVGETATISRFSAALEGSVKLGLKQGLAKGLSIGSSGLILGVAAFNCWYGSRLVVNHGVQGGTVFAVGATIAGGGFALGSALSNIRYLSEAAAAGERVVEMMNRVPTIDIDSEDGAVLEDFRGEVELKSVDFSYPSRPDSLVLDGFSLRIPAGQMVALVGKSGCGKSTVISLLQRFYDPLSGKILMDGVPIERTQLKWLRLQMGLVSQEPCLFATTIRENILFGKEDATMDEIIEAAKAANAHAFISQLPLGYDTNVGERGVQVSGGQKQRIAIARAIIRKPRIILLDEATSALDSESERLVQDALDKATIGRTTIVIAHRLSTIRDANTIAVVQDGKVAQTGPHGVLIQDENGLYASLIRSQDTNNDDEELDYDDASGLRCLSNVSGASSHRSFNSTHGSFVQSRGLLDHRPAPSFRRLLAMNSPEWRQAGLGCLSAALFGAVQPVYAFVMGAMIWALFLDDKEEMARRIRAYAVGVGALAGFSVLVNVSQHWSFAYMGERLTKRLRETMLSKILTFEVEWFEQPENSSGAICSRLAKDANVVRSLVGDRMALIVQTISATATACAMGLAISWRLALVMIAVQPLVIACYYTRRVLIKSMSHKASKAHSHTSSLAAESVSNIRTVTAFSAQPRLLRMLRAALEAPRRISLKQSRYAGLGLSASQAVMTLTWALDFWFGGRLVAAGHIGAQSLFQTFMILISTGRMIADAGSVTTDLAKGAESVGSVFAILDRFTRIEPNDHEGLDPGKITGLVSFHNVHFCYPTRPETLVLDNFSHTMQAGKSTALVGRSGSGKSTIISLIERFYDPKSGCVRIDGHDIRKYNLRSLRKHVALVSQEPTLFSGTIRENIAYGGGEEKAAVSEAEVVAAAKAANAHEMISGLRDGYETRCGERGVQLSGGQRQRIAIARAMLRNPRILLLDEATSALDGEAEKGVKEAVERVMEGRTSVVVAHRVSAVRGCGEIVVVEKGRVAEKGTHSELMAKGASGKYYSLVSKHIT